MMKRTAVVRAGSFSAIMAMLAIVWLVVLPAYSRQPQMRRHLHWLDERGIDPSAMYYTELPVMERLLAEQRLDQLRRANAFPVDRKHSRNR
ncbi:hypothetical protein [Roseiconus lacunae]|uniref:Uncharacterized protein n=1 Tax=Roseiconus lacunae TaxID=2605694 RepID=A0ABT7PGV4_9BACT|nr:hypothetical protein [Roseiconus lacunae]MDM4015476.1 hypothetical protein [Roseiconus lacunae]